MGLLLLIILVGLLTIVAFQDFKSREISWFLIPLLLIGFTANALLEVNYQQLLTYTAINLSLLVINLLGVTLLVSVKEKRIVNIVDNYLGLGDILFFVVLVTVFSPINFILFFLGSILLTTMFYGIAALVKNKQVLIPLAGAMSVMLISIMAIQVFTSSFHFYRDIIFFID